MTTQNLLVAQAVQHYRKGDYKQALKYYQQAAAKYGLHLFQANVQLCEQKLNGKALNAATSLSQTNTSGCQALAQQLQQTQQLLEQYYTRTQELEYQLQDR